MNKDKLYFEKHSCGELLHRSSFFREFQQSQYETLEKYTKFSELFYSADVEARKQRFGTQTFCTSDSANRRIWVWRLGLPSGIIWILTGKNGRGTSYEYYTTDDKIEQLVKELIYVIMAADYEQATGTA